MTAVTITALFFLLVLAFGAWTFAHNRTLRAMPGGLPIATKAETVCGFVFYIALAVLFAWACWAAYDAHMQGIYALWVQMLTVAFGVLYSIPTILTACRLNGAVAKIS